MNPTTLSTASHPTSVTRPVAPKRREHLLRDTTFHLNGKSTGYLSLEEPGGGTAGAASQLTRTGLLARVSSLHVGGCLNAQKWPLIPIRVRISASLCRPNIASLSGCLAIKGHSDRRGGHIGSCRRTLSQHTGVFDHLRSSRRQNRDRRTSL